MKLTKIKCDAAKPKKKPYKVADGEGMYLEIRPNGSKYWRLRYRMHGKQKLFAIGVYPEISLKEARERRRDARELLREGIDPSQHKRNVKRIAALNASNTFEVVAREWHDLKNGSGWSDKHSANILRRLEMDLLPYLGKRPITEISAPEVLDTLRKIEKRGALDIASRIRGLCSQIFRYGIQTGKCTTNPVPDLAGALKTKKTEHFAALDSKDIPELLHAIQGNNQRLYPSTRRAILFSLLTFVRPGELRKAKWEEFDFSEKLWTIPAERMKMRRDHIVPLSKQVIALLKEQQNEYEHINTPWVFPSLVRPKDPMSDGTVLVALKRMGFKGRMTAHGFRALARTTIREKLDYEPDVIEAQLAHKAAGPLGEAYNRAQHLTKRKKMMQQWANYIDSVGSGAEIIKGKFGKVA